MISTKLTTRNAMCHRGSHVITDVGLFRSGATTAHTVHRHLDSEMVRVEEVQDESEKLRQQGLEVPRDDEDEWEATDSDEDVCIDARDFLLISGAV